MSIIKTKGIVFSTVKYSESSLVCRIYTETLGLQSFFVNSVRNKKSGTKAIMFQPLTLLDIVFYHKEKDRLNRMKEVKNGHPLLSLPFDMMKSSIALFMAEIMQKTIREQEANKELFNFLHHAIIYFDATPKAPADFHLLFLLQLTRYLGFYPNISRETAEDCFFDLREGKFTGKEPAHFDFIGKTSSWNLLKLLGMNFDGISSIKIDRNTRLELLDGLIRYYQIHLNEMGELKSHKVLHEVIG